MSAVTCSIVVTSFNYEAYLAEAIDSALGQTRSVEVVVVDDGSTDGSRDVIASYGDRVIPVLKANGGQGSAFNAGAAAASSDVILFLDADDILDADAVDTALLLFDDPAVVKVHWPLRLIDADGRPLPGEKPGGPLPSGDLAAAVLAGGPTSSLSAPTSGNAWRRSFLDRVLPVPEDVPYYRSCADEYLYTLAPVFGRVAAVRRPLGSYRLHGANVYSARDAVAKVRFELTGHEQQCAALAATLARNDVGVDIDAWRRSSWFHRLQQALHEITATVPAGSSFVLADEEVWGAEDLLADREVVAVTSLTEVGGSPSDDEDALRLLPNLRRYRHVVFGWPAFWWFDHYPTFARRLLEDFRVDVDTDVVRVLERRDGGADS